MLNSALLRNLLNSKSILKVSGAFDSMSAKLVEMNDFDAIWASSFAISATHALPDASIVTMTEFLNVAENMVYSCSIPVIADCDTGFGDANNVRHMVKKYEKAGIAAVCIEDKLFPKQNSLANGKDALLSEKEFVAKIIAAKEAKQNDDFMVIARVEALIAGFGLEEALSRANAYSRAGADAILIHSKSTTPDEIFKFSDSWNHDIPLVVIPTTFSDVTIQELISHKIKMVIYANQTLRVAHAAMSNLLNQLKNASSLNDVTENMSSMEDIFHLQEFYNMQKQEQSIKENLKRLGYIN